jgi:hypothetical protein
MPLQGVCTREFVHPSHPDFTFENTPGREWAGATDLPWGGNPLAWPYRTGFIAGRVVIPHRWTDNGVAWVDTGRTMCRYESCSWSAPTTWDVELEHIYWVNESLAQQPTGLLRLIRGTEEVLDQDWARVAFVAEGIPLDPSQPNVVVIRHNPEYRDDPPYERAGIIVFEVDPSLLVVPVTVHIGVDRNGAYVVDDETALEWFGVFRPWDMHEVWAGEPGVEPWHRLYTEYTSWRPWRSETSPPSPHANLARQLDRVDVVFGQCSVGFEVQVVHHADLIAASDQDLLDSTLASPSSEVMSRAIPGRVNIFVAGFKADVGGWGFSWHGYNRTTVVSLQAIERASLGFGARRVVAHEVGHDLDLSDDWSTDTTKLMNVDTPPRGGVVLDSAECAVVRRDAELLAAPAAKADSFEP